MEKEKTLCFECGKTSGREGTITMNCSKHPVRKRCCETCYRDVLENKTKCVEENCGAQVNIRKVTRTFHVPWKLESWEFYQKQLTMPSIIILAFFLFFVALFLSFFPTFVQFIVPEYLKWENNIFFIYNAASAFFITVFSMISLMSFIVEYGHIRTNDPKMFEAIYTFCIQYYCYYALGVYLLLNLFYLWSSTILHLFFPRSLFIIFIALHAGVQGALIYHFRSSIYQFFQEVQLGLLNYFSEEKIEEIFLENDNDSAAV